MIPFQRDGSQVLEIHSWVVILARDWGEDLHFKGVGEVYNCKFSKVNVLRKEKSGVHSRQEICLKCSQAEENSKAILANK